MGQNLLFFIYLFIFYNQDSDLTGFSQCLFVFSGSKPPAASFFGMVTVPPVVLSFLNWGFTGVSGF